MEVDNDEFLAGANRDNRVTAGSELERIDDDIAFSGTLEPSGPRRGRSAKQPLKKAFKVENPIAGEIFCPHPDYKAPMILSERGCNIQTCTNSRAHGGSYFYFCCHCKKSSRDYLSDCSCSSRNDMVTRLREQKRRNEHSRLNPIVIDDDEKQVERQGPI